MTAPAATGPAWRLRGNVILACNCDYGCPCNFNGLPTPGQCDGNWNWHVTEGTYGNLSLSGLSFSLAAHWPAAIHQGNGNGVFVMDERANPAQRQAIETLVNGKAGGPWKIIATTIAKLNGPLFVPYEVKFDGFNSRMKAGDVIVLDMEPVSNPVTKVQVHPRAILPEGFVFKDGMLGRSTNFKITGPVPWDHTGKYAAAAEFEYSGP